MKTDSKYVRMMMSIGVTGLASVVNYLITLFLTPYITDNVGTEAYGFVTLAKNIAQYAIITTLALNAYATRYIAVEYHRGDMKKARMYFTSTFFGDVVIGFIVFLAAVIGIIYLEKIFTIPESIVPDVKLLFTLIFLKLFASTVLTAYESGAVISDRLAVVSLFKLVSHLVEAAVLLVAYRFFIARVYYVGIGLLAASMIMTIGNVYLCRRYTPELKLNRKNFSFSAIRKLVRDGIWNTINDLGTLLHSGLDLVICNWMLTPLTMGQLSIAKDFELIFSSLYIMVANAFHPMLLKSYAENDKETLVSQLKLSMKISGCLSNLAFCGFMALGLAFFNIWIPNQDTDLIYRLTLVTILTSVAYGPIIPLQYIYTLTVKLKFPCIVTIITGMINVAGMYVLIRFTQMGVWAVVWTTVVLVVFINFVSNPVYMSHVLGISKRTFYPEIIRNILSCGLISLLFLALSRIYLPHSWLTLILCALVYAPLGICVHFGVCFSAKERSQILQKIKLRFGHHNG